METPTSSGHNLRPTRTATPLLSERKRQLFRSRSCKLNQIEDDDDDAGSEEEGEQDDPLLGVSPLKPYRGKAKKLLKKQFSSLENTRSLRSSVSSSPETNKENKRKTRVTVGGRGGGGGVVEQLPHLFTTTMRLGSPQTPRGAKRKPSSSSESSYRNMDCNSSMSSPISAASSGGKHKMSSPKQRRMDLNSSLSSPASSTASPISKQRKLDLNCNMSSPGSKPTRTSLECSIPSKAFYSKPGSSSSVTKSFTPRFMGALGTPTSRTHKTKSPPKSFTRPRSGINRGVRHMIRKPQRPHSHAHHLPPTPMDDILSSLRNEKLRKLITNKREERAKVEQVHQILRSAQDPIKMAKPLSVNGRADDANNNNSTADFSDLSEDEEQRQPLPMELEPIIPLIKHEPIIDPPTDLGKRKFFKSGRRSSTCMEVRITDNIRASVSQGKIALVQMPLKKPRRVRVKSATIFSAEQATVDAILKNFDDSVAEEIVESAPRSASAPPIKNDPIECPPFEPNPDPYWEYRQRLPFNTQDPEIIEQQLILLEFLISNNICTEENFRIFIADPESHKEEANRIVDELYMVVNAQEAVMEEPQPEPEPKLFPIFTQRLQIMPQKSTRRKPEASLRLLAGATGSNQYQIDAGQKAYGPRQCQQCGLVYTVHEPEEEQLHRDYHNSVHILRFKGWIDEDIVAVYPEWANDGRIIRLNERAPLARRQRLTDMIRVVDKELGYASFIVPKIFVAFFAVRKQQIVGLCLVQPLNQAHRFIQVDGTDYFSEETYEASCGVSRIWVSPLQRRRGIARKLMRAVQCHTILGQEIPVDRIAFSTPTDDGRALAKHITQNDNFLTYDQ